ncbi:ABC transporter ATP-binding protein [Cellulomonas sp. WB94]|uniref:ABC transporter ATP-binding protein n=1 Tax=Cellulomonas sp. WB94 TaxID=2173174 RepID=UPI000D57A5CD|nr:ABC transporter ATP-binding protein [Cellulomonas sp. WB94]PVU83112.1 ABC transporter ATP-binding protein [Cellulomonas sp. WB94]
MAQGPLADRGPGIGASLGQSSRGQASGARGLSVRGLVVRYPAARGTEAVTAVDDVTLDIAPGEVLALLGPSGCGKSSLLRAVAGLEPAAAGTVAWDGADLAGVPVHRRGFGLMFQDGQLFPHRDVAGNVEFGLRMAGLDRPAREARVRELLEVVGLAGYERRPVATLSGGEQQRVALARSLAPSPRLLLLDEPLSALDRALRERLAEDLRTALTATGTTALLVTHDHDEAFAVADRIAVMEAGRLLQVAEPAELWQRPLTRQVAEFLGYEAFVPLGSPAAAALHRGLVGPGSDPAGDLARSMGGSGAGPAAGAFALAPGALLVTGDSAAPPPLGRDDDPGLRGTVVGVGFQRGRVELTVEVAGVGRVTVHPPASTRLVVGSVVELTVDAAAVARVD